MVLDCASERRFHSNDGGGDDDDAKNKKITYFTDVPLGMYIVRGDSIVLLGQVGSEEEETNAQHAIVTMKRLDQEEFDAMVAAGEDDKPDEPETAEGEESKSLEWDFDKDLLA